MMVVYILIIFLCSFIIFCVFKTYKYEDNLHMLGYNICRYLLKPLFKFWYPYKAINKELMNCEGPVIYAGNHIHLMDQCLAILVTDRPIHYMAKIEYFTNPKTRWFFKLVGCIPVDRSTKDENAKSSAMDVLNKGYALGIFPEGTRNKTDKLLQDFKFGAVSMAKKSGAKIVPFAITGDYKFRSKNLKITFGEPLQIEDDLKEENQKLYNEILKMIKKDRK